MIKVDNGSYANYYIGASGDHGYICAYGTGNHIGNLDELKRASARNPQRMVIQSNAVGVHHDGYVYASSRWGREGVVKFYAVE